MAPTLIAPNAETAKTSSDVEPRRHTDALVLIVEDNEPNQYAMTRVLQRAGYQVIGANRGQQALDLARDRRPDLVILDIGLPDIIGWDVCRDLKTGAATATIPVLQVSAGYVTEQDHAHSLDQGADSYLVHPIDPQVLLATVKALLRLKAAYEALRRSDERLHTILNNAPLILFAVDRNGVYTHFTGNRLDRMNLSPATMVGKSLYALHAGDDRFLANAGKALDGQTFVDQLPLYGRWFEIHYSAVRDSSTEGFVAVATDITDRKKAETFREELLAVVAHDLRNPINGIHINVAVLRHALAQALPEGAPPTIEETLARIARSVQLAERLITDLLDGAMIEAGTFTVNLARQDLRAVLLEAIEFMGPMARTKEIQVAHDVAPSVAIDCDGARLSQALCNLIDNAIKFSPPQASITIRSTVEANEVIISIEDRGSGISEADFPHLFDRFWQADRKTGHGAGLGLSIAAGIARAHGGRIWAEGREGAGATFYIALPRDAE